MAKDQTKAQGSELADSGTSSAEGKLAIPTTIKRIPVERIRRYRRQPRFFFEKYAMRNLRGSFEALGQGEPISVRPVKDDPKHDWELVDGERRLRTARKMGQKTVVAIIYHVEDELTQFKLALLKNSGRAPHQVLEVYEAVNRLTAEGCDAKEIAHLLSIHVVSVSKYRSLSRLSDRVRQLMSPDRPYKERLHFSAAIELVDLPEKDQWQLGQKAAFGNLSFKQLKHAARRIGASLPRMVGEEPGSGSYRTPNKDYTMFRNFVTGTADEADLWSVSSDQDYNRIFANRQDTDRRNLIKKLEEAVRSLEKIRGGLQRVSFRTFGTRVNPREKTLRLAT